MAPVKLYGAGMSTCTRRVLIALEEKEIPYELVPVDLMKGEQKSPEFLKMQPFGMVPVLVDGDIQIFESRAIIRYLATKFADQGTPLYGSSERERALTENWLEAEAQNYNPPVSTIVSEKLFNVWRGQTTDEAVVAKSLGALEKVLDIYETRLADNKYIAGSHFSLADLAHIPYTVYMLQVGVDPLSSRPHVKAWWDSIISRPSVKKVLGA